MIANRAQDIRAFVEEHGYPLEINKPYEKRSPRQSRLYWQWMTVIGNFVGHSKEEIHEFMMDEFAPRHEVLGKVVVVRTSDMTPSQMTYYMGKIKTWAYEEFELILPEPDDNKEIR